MHISPLQLADAPSVAVLCDQLGYPSSDERVRARLSWLFNSACDACFGAYERATLIGWIHVQGRSVLETEPFAEICALIVDERVRSLGTGGALMNAAEAWAREKGYARTVVRSNVMRERAHDFYRRLGYEQGKTSHVFKKAL